MTDNDGRVRRMPILHFCFGLACHLQVRTSKARPDAKASSSAGDDAAGPYADAGAAVLAKKKVHFFVSGSEVNTSLWYND